VDSRLAKRIGVGVGIAAIVYLGLAIYADWGALRQALARFRWPLLVPVFGLSCTNYLVRFRRWQLYLRRADVSVPALLSLRIFCAGLVMSVTPGKLGELLKAYLVRAQTGTPVSRTGPIVIAERVTDLVALFVLLFIGSLVYHTGWMALCVSGAVALVLVAGLASPRVAALALHWVERIPGARRYGEKLESAYDTMRFLLRPRLLVEATLLGSLAWFAECSGFALVLLGFDIPLRLGFATFVYAFSTLVGALLLVPGGVGGTEGSMVALLMTHEVTRSLAVAATFVVRVATLWFAVLVGAVVLLLDPKLMARASEMESERV
jgi:glycosyltransferase 2 family protein